MAATVARQAAGQFPDVTFTIVSRPFLRPLFDGLPNLKFVEADTTGAHHGLRGLWKLFRLLRSLHPSAVADIHNVLRTQVLHLLFTLSGTRVYTIEKGRRDKRRLIRRRRKIRQPLDTSFERYRRVLEKCVGQPLSPDAPCPVPSFPNKVARHAKYAVGIAPFAAHEGKIYPLDKTEQVVAHFAARPDVQVFLFGGGTERGVLEQWERKHPQVQSVAGKLDLAAELALIQQLSVMVSMDSANMHLASFVGTPVVSVWGATHPHAGFYGWRQPPGNAVSLDLPCRPCSVYGNRKCFFGDYRCLHGIAPEAIIDKVNSIIENRPRT
jgi:ADP-heptose:LPS heptosyltransferase